MEILVQAFVVAAPAVAEFEQGVQGDADRGERVADLVGDAGGEQAQRLSKNCSRKIKALLMQEPAYARFWLTIANKKAIKSIS